MVRRINEQGDTQFRRTWDKKEYELKAKLRQSGQLERDRQQEKQQHVNELLEKRAAAAKEEDDALFKPTLIKAREGDLGFESAIGKTTVVQTADGTQPGFHCEICDRTYKDNLSYLDHINSVQHLHAMGHTLRTDRSTVEQVRARLMKHKMAKSNPAVIDFKAEREKRILQEEKEKEQRKEDRKKRKEDMKQKQIEAEDQDGDMAAMMGF
eukprot:jgi/Hompol1/148/HPOL_003931-RA